MTKSVRRYFNQWILQTNYNLNKALFNLDRIAERVAEKGNYEEIQRTIRLSEMAINTANRKLIRLQSLFNDPRSKKIEV